MRPRLIATDLDGTLLRTDGSLGPATARVLRLVAAAGIPVVPATARPLRWLRRYPWAAGLRYLVFGNGAVVYDTRAGAVVRSHLLAPSVLAELCGRISARVPAARYAVEADEGRTMWHEPEYPLRSDLGQPGVRSASRPALLRRPAVKLLVKAPGGDPAGLAPGVVSAVGGRAEVTMSTPQADLVELAAPGVTKATGVADVAGLLGVPATGVVAFGDMPNDLSMLSWAGRAVAVANAHPEVLAVADEVTGSNDEDGVATWLIAALRRRTAPAPRSGTEPGPPVSGDGGSAAGLPGPVG